MRDCSRHLLQNVFCDLLFSHRSCQLNFWRKKSIYWALGRAGISKSKVESTFSLSTSCFCCGGNREKRGLPFPCRLPPALPLCVPRVPCEEEKNMSSLRSITSSSPPISSPKSSKGNPRKAWKKTSTLLPFPQLNWISRKLFFTSLGTAQVLFSASFVWGMCTFRQQSHFL